jgi:hypothetical protein
MQENSVALSDDIVIAVAKRFYAMIPRVPNEKELQFSHEWLDRFKKRFNIRGYTCHGEESKQLYLSTIFLTFLIWMR